LYGQASRVPYFQGNAPLRKPVEGRRLQLVSRQLLDKHVTKVDVFMFFMDN
jgi:hypothetical protein